MSSLEKAKPGIRPRFLSQKMDAKEPEKKMPSTVVNVIRQTLAKGRALFRHPPQSPISLAFDTGNGFDGTEKVVSLRGVLDECINEERVGFRVNIFHHNLEAVKAASLGSLYLIREMFHEILIYDSVRSREEGKNVGDKVLFVIV